MENIGAATREYRHYIISHVKKLFKTKRSFKEVVLSPKATEDDITYWNKYFTNVQRVDVNHVEFIR